MTTTRDAEGSVVVSLGETRPRFHRTVSLDRQSRLVPVAIVLVDSHFSIEVPLVDACLAARGELHAEVVLIVVGRVALAARRSGVGVRDADLSSSRCGSPSSKRARRLDRPAPTSPRYTETRTFCARILDACGNVALMGTLFLTDPVPRGSETNAEERTW